jgi:glyoxylase-like metal-dependent hydrolase (beta-lactamase superfamily II)
MGALFRSSLTFRELFRSRAWEMYFNPNRNIRARKKPARHLDVTLSEDERRAPANAYLKDGDTLENFPNWTVIHSPGHSWDSCCYFHKRSRSLISGDMLLGSGKRGLLVTPSIYSNPVQMAQSVKRMQELKPTSVYPGHGSFFEGENLLAHLG